MKTSGILFFILFFISPVFARAAAPAQPLGGEFYQDFISAAWYEKHGDFKKALEYYEKLHQTLPDDITILKGLAQAAILLENREAMEKYIPALAALAPADAEAVAASAALLWSRGDLSGALAQYERAVKIAPDDAGIIFKYITLLASIDSDRAIAYLKTLGKRYPGMAGNIALQIAELYLKDGDKDNAVAYLKEAAKQYPDAAQPRLGLIMIYESMGDSTAALAQYLELEKVGLADAAVLTKIVADYVLGGKKDLSRQYFLKVKAMDDGSPQAAQFLMLAAQEQGDYAAALAYLQAGRGYETTPASQIRAAYFYNRLGEPAKSAEVLKKAYEDAGRPAETGLYYAFALIDLQDYKNAARVLREVLEKSPGNEAALFHLATVLERLKEYKEMEKYLRQLIEIAPEHADGLNFLGYYLVDKTKRVEEGGGYIKRALALSLGSSAVADSMAWYYYKTGDLQKALDLLEGIAPSAGDDWEILLHTALVYEQLGDYAKARVYFEKVLQLEPANKPAARGLKRVKRKLK
ncbi:MAG: tetratricopeptide repeat protein [Elusimicrobiota bacterium]|jgi:tetratricopeptide (TPR) repeat protein|nr:tetratricopeptide repeat protein [Elusimicrobiota bacterium]